MHLVHPGLSQKVCVLSSSGWERAQHWSHFFQCPLNPVDPKLFPYQFYSDPEHTYLLDFQGRRLEIDFDKNHLDYARRSHRGKNELIAKALGASKGYKRILDLSVGMAVDSVFLCQLGFDVVGVERSPILYALLSEAFQKTQNPILKNYQLHFDDSLNFLKTHKGNLEIDAIYFDPMYPHKKKSALPKQEMVVFRDLVGDDVDSTQVFEEALLWPVHRVVVKRPLHAEILGERCTHSYTGKVVRYDTYVVG